MTKDETLKLALDFLMTRRLGAESVIDALHEALAQPEQEPVLEVITEPDHWHEGRFRENTGRPYISTGKIEKLKIGTKLYTSPPKRKEWIGLSSFDMDDITSTEMDNTDAMLITEAKLKELNHGL